ncbi:uncharacterized protein LOC133649977 [Entelurus aequoreus]|uniref:uncharacterized protein LOC133649977 n=1 Tax=Entelurus aequoreus TaxID=161455 RepID=UPI002B1DD9E2|nr:uncharacterized protein LOC133649977 [Entelurus aequoreus]
MHTQLVGIILGIIGLLGTGLICGLPAWKVTPFVGANIITAQIFWEGLWMNCVIQSTGQSQCKAYDSILALPRELQASRALVCVSLAVGAVAVGLVVLGARCTSFFRHDWPTKNNVGMAAGVVFVLAGVLVIIPVSLMAHSIITGFFNPLPSEERRGELGASVYVGWVSGALLVIGGVLICSTFHLNWTQQHGGRAPADVERGAELPPLSGGHQRVVEVPDDGVGRPRHGDHDEQGADDEHDARHDARFGLGRLVLHAVGALPAGRRHQHAQHAHHHRDHHHGAGRLQVLGQRQHGVVDLALHLARALHHAGHPQTLPDHLRRHDVGAHERRHPPHGQGARDDGAHPAHEGQQHGQHLEALRRHRRRLGIQIFAGRRRRGFGACGAVPSRVGLLALGGAVAAQHAAPDDHQGGRPPADVERRPQLSLLGADHQRVVEVLHHAVCRPTHGDQAEDAGDDEDCAGGDGHLGLGGRVLHAVGAFPPRHRQQDGHDAHHDGDDHEGAGGLQLIHTPSCMVCEVTMLLPMNAVTLHMGRAHVTMAPIQPRIPRAAPRIWKPADTMALPPSAFCLFFVSEGLKGLVQWSVIKLDPGRSLPTDSHKQDTPAVTMGERFSHKPGLCLKSSIPTPRVDREERTFEEVLLAKATGIFGGNEGLTLCAMSSFGLELVGVSVAVVGWLLSVVSCALPMWRVSAFIGANIVTAQVYWEGLWMTCVFQSTGQMQCKVYDSMLALPQDLQAARALTVVSIIVGVLSLLISLVGAKCTNCIEDEGAKARVMISSGAGFIVAALTQLVPVSWSANTIVVEFYSLIIPSGQKMEIGAALYLGWAAAALLLIGGSILCCSCPPKEEKASRYSMHPQSRVAYSAAPKSTAQSSYNRRDYLESIHRKRTFFCFDSQMRRVTSASTRMTRTESHRLAYTVDEVIKLEECTVPPSPHFPTAIKDKGGAAMSMGLEIVGISLGMLGFLMAIVTCALPMWKVTAFIGANIITAQVIWEGLWMNCVTQSTGQMQCKVYDSLLALSPELQASRAMIIIAIILGVLGVLVSIMGAKCTNCIEDVGAKARVMIVSGVFFVLAGLLVLIPASWYASVIVRDFYNPIVTNAQRRELGAALYIGWGAAALLLIGGAMLCSSCPPKDKRYKPPRMAYSAPRSNNGPAATHDRKDYV